MCGFHSISNWEGEECTPHKVLYENKILEIPRSCHLLHRKFPPAYYLEWHLRKRLAPMLFEDDDPEGATAQRKTPVQKAEVSERAKQKAATRITETGLPAHSLRTMLQDPGNLTCNEATLPGQPNHPFTITAQPTPLQVEAFQRLGVEPSKMIPVPLHP